MNRTTRIRKAPNRDPVSLAATTLPTTTPLVQNEAIDTIEVVAIDPNLDPALLNKPIVTPPIITPTPIIAVAVAPTPTPILKSIDTNTFNFKTSFEYPSP